MNIGCFSMSLSVKDINQSKAFYEKLGFKQYAGDLSHNFVIMKNGDTNIGLFQEMFEGNILTFNPGWDQNANALTSFKDVRDIQKHLISQGIEIAQDSITQESGPSSFTVIDPDGNAILFDQHV